MSTLTFAHTLLRMIAPNSEKRKETKDSLAEDIDYLKRGGGSSVFHTFVRAAALASFGTQIPQNLFESFATWVHDQRDVLALPYDEFSWTGRTRQGSAARNIPSHLALYLVERTEKRREILVAALHNWWTYSEKLGGEAQRDHTEKGPHRTAPYHFYTSLPYVASAVKLLLKDPDLDETMRKSLVEFRNLLRENFPRLVGNHGLNVLQGGANFVNTTYKNAEGYTYPLYGLALLPLLEQGDSCYSDNLENDFGIIIYED